MAKRLRPNGRSVTAAEAARRAAAARERASNDAATTGGPDSWDRRSHLERINHPFDNPAAIPGLGIIHKAKG
jgi:hypothetical protein